MTKKNAQAHLHNFGGEFSDTHSGGIIGPKAFRYIIGPKAFRVAMSAFPPALLDALFKGDTTMVGGEEYYCTYEGARDHALEIVWEESSPVKPFFNILTALDLRDT